MGRVLAALAVAAMADMGSAVSARAGKGSAAPPMEPSWWALRACMGRQTHTQNTQRHTDTDVKPKRAHKDTMWLAQVSYTHHFPGSFLSVRADLLMNATGARVQECVGFAWFKNKPYLGFQCCVFASQLLPGFHHLLNLIMNETRISSRFYECV